MDFQKCPPDAWGCVEEDQWESGETAVLTDVGDVTWVEFYENTCPPEHIAGPFPPPRPALLGSGRVLCKGGGGGLPEVEASLALQCTCPSWNSPPIRSQAQVIQNGCTLVSSECPRFTLSSQENFFTV